MVSIVGDRVCVILIIINFSRNYISVWLNEILTEVCFVATGIVYGKVGEEVLIFEISESLVISKEVIGEAKQASKKQRVIL